MTPADIQKEWDSFIEYPEGSDKLYVTTTSALIFARVIAEMTAAAERKECARICDEQAIQSETNMEKSKTVKARDIYSAAGQTAHWMADAIRARGGP